MHRLPALAVVALLACVARDVATPSGGHTESSSETDSGGETESASDTESGTETDTDTDTESDTDTETESGTDTDTADPCDSIFWCESGQICIDFKCVDVGEPPECAGPVVVTLPQPPANGHVVAIDLVDFQQDGDVEILAWIDGVGVGVLDDAQWTMTEYLPVAQVQWTSIAAVHVDDDELLDVLVQDSGGIAVGLGDGAGGFAFVTDIPVLAGLRGIEVAPDERRAFGIITGTAKYLSFDVIDQPTYVEFVELSYPVSGLMPAQLDAAGSEDVVLSYTVSDWFCKVHPTRLHPTEPAEMVELELWPQNNAWSGCSWLGADLDGNGRDDLVAHEQPYVDASFTLLSALANTTEPAGPLSFAARELAILPEQGFADVVHGADGDFDGDGDDELLFLRDGDADATLVWASDGQLLGCMAEVPGFVDSLKDIRTGDIDGDDDDEVVLFRPNGELRVLDFQ